MAAYFWVTGGTGNWNSASNWALTSGGIGGIAVPGSGDTATIDANSGSGSVTLDISPDIQTLTCTGFTGTLAFGTNTISLNSTGTIFTGATTMTVTGTPQIICTNSSATLRTITPTTVTEVNSISFRVTAGTGAVTTTGGAYRDLDFTDGTNPTGFAGTISSNSITVYGNLKASTGMLVTAGTAVITFAATSGTKTIDTAGVTFDRPFTFNGVGGTFQLVSALTSGATRTATLTNGTLNLNNFTLTTGLFATNTSNATTLAFGTGNITLSGTGTIFTGSTTCTVTGTPQVICTNSSATARTITPQSVTEANTISFRITAGTGGLTLTGGNYRDLDFTDGVNPTGYAGAIGGSTTQNVYGNFKASTGMTQTPGASGLNFVATSGTKTINTAGVTFDRPIAFNGVGGTFQLQAALTSGSTRTCTLTNGTLDLASYTLTTGIFSSTNSNVRTLAFGTGKIVLTATSGTIFTTSTSTNLTVTGTNPLIQATSGGAGTRTIIMGAAGESNAISVDVTAGSDQISLSTTSGAYRNISAVGFTGNLNFANSIAVFGNFDVGTATALTGTSSPNFAATSGTKTLRSNSLTFPVNVQFSGIGGAWSLQDALSVTSTITLNNGTLTTNGYAVTAGLFSSSNTNTRVLNLGASTVTLVGSGTPWNTADPTNMTLNAGTSTITTTSNTAGVLFAGGGLTYYNVTFGATYYNNTLTGANTFNNLTVASPAGAGRRAVSFSANQTINGTLTCSGSAANSRPRLSGIVGGTTITAAAVSLANADFGLIIAAGASSPWSGTRLGDLGYNTNITFATPKTVYWNQPAGGNWSDVAWALTSGGAVGANNFPLPQDTAILDNTGVGASSTIVMDYGWGFQLSAGSLTNALTLNWNCFAGLTASSLGDFTLSSAITITYTAGALGINSLGSLSTITTAGVVIPIITTTFNASGKTLRLADNFTATGTNNVGFSAGTLDLNGKTLTCVIFDSTFTELEVRVLAFNGGQIDVTGNNATVWACEDLTNFSYTGTPTVNFTYSGSTGTRTINNGTTAGGTEANAVDFNIVAGADIFGTPVGNIVRNFTIQPAFTGQASIFGSGFIYGNFLLSPNQTVSASANTTTFAATSGTKTITTNGVTIDRSISFSGVGGTWTLQDALTMGSARILTLTNGTLNSSGYTVTTGSFALGSGTKTLTMGASTWSISGNWDALTNDTGFTLNAGTSTISMNSASANSFIGNSKTYYILRQAGLGTLSISGSNIFNSISNTVQPTTLRFTAGSTQTVNTFNVSGTAGNLVTLNSLTPGSQFTLAKNTGSKVLVSYVSITDSAATPAGYWFAPTSQGNVNGGNNTGWNFGATGATSGFLSLF
tara:strand:+ start:1531 stop:5568 length:4038 start_codon:yes stop_codon:yes gene_type:complete